MSARTDDPPKPAADGCNQPAQHAKEGRCSTFRAAQHMRRHMLERRPKARGQQLRPPARATGGQGGEIERGETMLPADLATRDGAGEATGSSVASQDRARWQGRARWPAQISIERAIDHAAG
eukprot:scaffold4498_cov119-Isochrysis_galbana.AAC.37